MAKIRVPGVYFEPSVRQSRGIMLGETGVPAFLGVAERGPLRPVKVTSAAQFKIIYGTPIPGSYLSSCVDGFFKNGGQTCFVLRIAHIFGDEPEEELARRAKLDILDRNELPTLNILAASEGSWGNGVTLDVSVAQPPRIQTPIARDLQQDSETASLRSSRGFEPGMTVCFYAGGGDERVERFVTITRVRGNHIFWVGEIGHNFRAAAPTYLIPIEFNISASTKNRKEWFPHLSLSRSAARYAPRVVNSESKLIFLRDLESPSPVPLNLPETEDMPAVSLRGGKDGLDWLKPKDFIGYDKGPAARFGLALLEENEDIDLVLVPDLHYAQRHSKGFRPNNSDIRVVHRALIDHCERLGDRFALLDLPEDTKINDALDARRQFDSAFGAIFYPWLVTVEKGQRKVLPPTGHIAGLIAKCDREEGLHRAAANLPMEGVVDTSIVLREEHLAELNHKGVNCIRSFPVRGIRPWGARTLSNDPLWRYIPTRRIFNAVKRAVFMNTQWAVFELNNNDLRRRLRSEVEDFLRRLWSAGYFKGDAQDDAFFVVCGNENNPQENLEQGLLVVDIGIAPIRPTEFITLRLEHTVEDRRLGDLSDIEE